MTITATNLVGDSLNHTRIGIMRSAIEDAVQQERIESSVKGGSRVDDRANQKLVSDSRSLLIIHKRVGELEL